MATRLKFIEQTCGEAEVIAKYVDTHKDTLLDPSRSGSLAPEARDEYLRNLTELLEDLILLENDIIDQRENKNFFEKHNDEILRHKIRAIAMLITLKFPAEFGEEKRLHAISILIAILQLNQLALGSSKLEEAALKCLNNVLYADMTLKLGIQTFKNGAPFKKLVLESANGIRNENVGLYFIVCMVVLTASSPAAGNSNGGIENVNLEDALEPNELVDVTLHCVNRMGIITEGITKLTKDLSGKAKLSEIIKVNLLLDSDNIIEKMGSVENGLKLLYALGATNETLLQAIEAHSSVVELTPEDIQDIINTLRLTEENVPLLDRIGFLTLRWLMAEVNEDSVNATEMKRKLRDVQHQCFCILMLATKISQPQNFIGFLSSQGVIAKACELTDFYLKIFPENPSASKEEREFYGSEAVIRARIDRNGYLLPMLIVLNGFAEGNEGVKSEVESFFFPYELSEPDYSSMTEEQVKISMRQRHMVGTTPNNVPGGRLITLMTAYDQNIKRFASELVWTVCDSDQDLFIRRAGYGNGVHLLAIKGGMLQQMQSGVHMM